MNSVTPKTISVINPEYLEKNRLSIKKLVRKYIRQIGLGNHYFKKTMTQLEGSMAFILGDNEGYICTQPIENKLVITQYYNMNLNDLDAVTQMAKEAGFQSLVFQTHEDLNLTGWKKGPVIWEKRLCP